MRPTLWCAGGDKRPRSLARAVAELGRIAKTLYLLAYLDDELYRRRILIRLNRGERRHSLARVIFHGQRGEVRQRYRQGQEDQLGALGLVLNCVVLWNTRYLDAAVTHLKAQGRAISDDDLARACRHSFTVMSMSLDGIRSQYQRRFSGANCAHSGIWLQSMIWKTCERFRERCFPSHYYSQAYTFFAESAQSLSAGPDLRDDEWHQVAVTVDHAVNSLRLFVDGIAVGEGPINVTYRSGLPEFTLGSALTYFSGTLD